MMQRMSVSMSLSFWVLNTLRSKYLAVKLLGPRVCIFFLFLIKIAKTSINLHPYQRFEKIHNSSHQTFKSVPVLIGEKMVFEHL